MRKALFCITTANQLMYSTLFLDSFAIAAPSGVDLVVVDDASADGTPAYLRAMGMRVLTKPAPRGLTDSWNIAYRLFRDEGYSALFLANNDILLPPGASENMMEVLERHILCGPLTTARGAGGQPLQGITPSPNGPDPMEPRNYIDIQRELCDPRGAESVRLPHINGFFLGMNRSILRYELPDGNLFNPNNVNIGNENDLCARVKEPKMCCVGAFVYHFKGRSFLRHSKTVAGRQLDRNYTWKQAMAFETRKGRMRLSALDASSD